MASLIGGFNFVSQISILPSRFVPDFQNLIQSNPSSSNLIWSILLSFVLYFFPSYLSVCPWGEDVKNVPSKKMLDLDKIETNLFRIKKDYLCKWKSKEGRKEGGKDGRKEGRKRTQTAKPRAALKNIESIKPTEIQSKPWTNPNKIRSQP